MNQNVEACGVVFKWGLGVGIISFLGTGTYPLSVVHCMRVCTPYGGLSAGRAARTQEFTLLFIACALPKV